MAPRAVRVDYLPLPGSDAVITRPVVHVGMEGIPEMPITCLADSGALHNRFDEDFAIAAGLDLEGAEEAIPFALGNREFTGRFARVGLSIGQYTWTAPVCFVRGWNQDFQLLGQEGFFRWFEVCLFAAD